MKKAVYLIALVGITFNISPLNNTELALIEDVVKITSNQMSLEERIAIAETLTSKSPCNCLVFGVGRDSSLWMELNKNGRTVFLEDDTVWLDVAKEEVKDIEAYLVTYNTKITQWKPLLNQPSRLKMVLPDAIANTKWDVIIVDAPTGYCKLSTGRMKSIFTASELAKKPLETDVFVHDCDRTVEKVYSSKFLLPKNLIKQIRKLRHYKIKN